MSEKVKNRKINQSMFHEEYYGNNILSLIIIY